MIVLGLHGWYGTHDAAAALVVDGRVVACIEEERLSRRKHALSQRPRLSAQAVLHHAGLGWEDVDVVGYGWDLPRYLPSHGQSFDFSNDRDFLATALEIRPRTWPELEWVGHHTAHAAAAYYSSGFSEAAVLVVDGQGENRSISLYAADPRGIRLVRDWPPCSSLGFLYQAATVHCGFGFLDGGKTMGLAAYGSRPVEPLPIWWEDEDLCSAVPDELEEEGVVRFWEALLAQRFGSPVPVERVFDPLTSALRWRTEAIAQHHPDVAAAAQETVERVLLGLVEYAQKATGVRNVVLAGGVALNCVANGRVADCCEAFFVPPAAHDAGAALGAAMLLAHQGGDSVRPVRGVALGLGYTPEQIEEVVSRSKLSARRSDDPAGEAARRVAAGNVVGWFQGRSEIGPRALGHRSILALPAPAANGDRVNRIKGRELWRPLAPSALASETPWMFGRQVTSPFMLRSLELTEAARSRIPAVAHVDGSTRVQTVRPDGGPFALLLREVEKLTGSGVVLNTSFNAPGEPVVCSPADAIRTYSTMGLDALVLGDFILEKRPC